MEDSALRHLSMIVVILGLIALIIILKARPLPRYDTFLNDRENYIGKKVNLEGTVEKITEKENSYTLTISRKDSITVNIPIRMDRPSLGEVIQIEGIVDRYKGNVFIRPEKLSRIDITDQLSRTEQ